MKSGRGAWRQRGSASSRWERARAERGPTLSRVEQGPQLRGPTYNYTSNLWRDGFLLKQVDFVKSDSCFTQLTPTLQPANATNCERSPRRSCMQPPPQPNALPPIVIASGSS